MKTQRKENTALILDYQNAKKLGEHAKRRAALSGQSPYLPALDDFLNPTDIASEEPLGILEVPLDLFAGTRTRGRQNAFACNFMPLLGDNSEFALKWAHLYDAQISEGLRDPVKAYEYLGRYYVEEGNKRVSVMKYLRAYSIHASVIRLVPKKTDEKHILAYYEYMDFYKVTGLNGFLFSEPGSYKRFAEIFGQNMKRRVCIVAKNEEKIRKFILYDLHSGATIYEAIGAYTMEKRHEIITIVDKQEYQKLMNYIRKEEPDAFVTIYNVADMRYIPKTY